MHMSIINLEPILLIPLIILTFLEITLCIILFVKSRQPKTNNETQPHKHTNHTVLKFFTIFVAILFAVNSVLYCIYKLYNKFDRNNEINTDGNPLLLNRSATTNDFTLVTDIEATITNLTISYILIPKYDIKNLEISFTFYNKSNKIIATKKKYISKVNQNTQYDISLPLTLSEFTNWNGYEPNYYVSGGTVSYFA